MIDSIKANSISFCRKLSRKRGLPKGLRYRLQRATRPQTVELALSEIQELPVMFGPIILRRASRLIAALRFENRRRLYVKGFSQSKIDRIQKAMAAKGLEFPLTEIEFLCLPKCGWESLRVANNLPGWIDIEQALKKRPIVVPVPFNEQDFQQALNESIARYGIRSS